MTSRGSGATAAPRRIAADSLPACLGDLPRRVAGLWCLGDATPLALAPDRLVGIVGTREASPYGLRMAERLATACAEAGLVVVSGLARGVDAAAHRAALAAGAPTIGVQGTGVDVPYPASHRALHEAMARRGTVLSEMEPGTLASPGCFPRRNRIIAALCRVTVVVEAGYRSGAINTATQALELGRTVAAVPGRIDDDRAAGGNLLLRDGAQVITGAEDLLSLMGAGGARRAGAAHGRAVGGTTDARGRSGGESDDPGELDARTLALTLLAGELSGEVRREGLRYISGS